MQRRWLQWTAKEDQALRGLASQGIFLRHIALKLGRSEDGVRRRADRLQIEVRAHKIRFAERR